jgi:uncharacterized protein YprB with RNaseH-like and TPR domain
MSSLTNKLKALGVKVGTADLPPPAPVRRYEIHAVVTGDYIPTHAGEVFTARQTFSADYLHGRASIRLETLAPALAAWSRDPRLGAIDPERLAFLDTETSGLAGGTGTYAFLIGVGRFAEGGWFQLAQFFMRDPAEEPAVLEGLAEFLAPCQALVTFNGKAFDVPLLNTRYALHRIPLPYKEYAHLDLLPLARRLWRDRLPSRALKYLEENILQAPRTADEAPGYEIPWLYFDYLRSGDAGPLKGVFYHNAMDVVAMAALLSHVSGMLADPFNGRVEHGLDFVALGKLYEDLDRWDEAARLYERGLESGLSETDFWVAVKRLSILQKRRGDIGQALHWWQQAADKGHLYACIELAKYHEHTLRDSQVALTWARAARERAAAQEMPAYVRQHWLEEIERRLARLERKSRVAAGQDAEL